MTFVLPPNTFVGVTLSTGQTVDVDQLSAKEGSANKICYDAVTSRSYHTGVVNVLLMDGSVRTVSSNIDPFAWRAAGSRAGGETLGLN
jgi:prepilin-type processing-associated H-X9-DG protein